MKYKISEEGTEFTTIEALTPDQAWDIYVGSQSPREFAANAEDSGMDIASEVDRYCAEHHMAMHSAPLDLDAREVLAAKLMAKLA